jgi:ribosomal protein S12 methylthiotransferase
VADGAATARSEADAPEIDGLVRIADARRIRVGDFADVRIDGSSAYDLTGRLV